MPKRSGLEVLRWLRRHRSVGQIPVAAVLSGSQISSDMEQARSLGADYFVKPVEYAALLELVREFCRRFNLV
jgi:DNA-binding response OmpR family regulator